MKKLSILLVMFILAAGLIFAQEETTQTQEQPAAQQDEQPAAEKERSIEGFNLEINWGFPVHWSNSTYDNLIIEAPDGGDKAVTADTAFGITAIFNFSNIIGLSLDFDFFYGGKIAGFASDRADYISLFGFDFYLGPVFYLFNNNLLRIPLSFGAHMYYFADERWAPIPIEPSNGLPQTENAIFRTNDMQFGPYLSLGVQFHFNKDLYVFSKTTVAIDLFRFMAINGGAAFNDSISVNWLVKPAIGLGIKH